MIEQLGVLNLYMVPACGEVLKKQKNAVEEMKEERVQGVLEGISWKYEK